MWIAKHAALAAVCGVAAATGAAEAKTIKMTAVAAPGPQVAVTKITKEFFIPEVNKRIAASGQDFKIEWTEAYAETLAKFTEVFETVENGIAHLGAQIPPFEASKIPLEQYSSQIPFGVVDPMMMTEIDAVIHRLVPEMAKAWTTHNQINLGGSAPDGWHLATKNPVRSVDQMNGLRIGTAGPAGEWLRGTGAVRVNTSLGYAATDIRNGVYDGALSAHSLTFAFKVHESARHVLEVNFGVTIAVAASVNLDTWNAFPDFVKVIFSDVGKEWTVLYSDVTAKQAVTFKGLMEKAGTSFTALPEAERKRWAARLPNIPKQWAERMDSQGLPGTKIVRIYMDEARKRGVQFVRDWDRE
jgi:TRAP-type C4-dicarboxylate transport system substrate-binding protein